MQPTRVWIVDDDPDVHHLLEAALQAPDRIRDVEHSES
jgi:DNA-binding NtrC family response regulator